MGTKIPWTDEAWNPVTGCTWRSHGCQNCYAEKMANRLRGRFGYDYHNPFQVTEHRDRLALPYMKWRKPRLVFVDSMGDLFHGHVFKRYISAVFGVMAATPHHTYQVLTKRPENVRDWLNWLEGEVEIGTGETPLRVCLEYAWRSNKLLPRYLDVPWPLKNVWLIVSAEDQERLEERAASLMYLPAAVRGVSLEPLLGPVRLRRWIDRYYGKSYNSLDWVIVGCESGPGRRPFKLSWARSIKNQCVEHGVPFFFKQAPGHVEQDGYVKEKILEMPELDGKVWNQYPDGYER